ncbi:Protein shisa-4 [Merluccius polli]|uniref:Protein shisa-4 n=1 Tax=Merluccius polli TaxID=89951 RepID=A0AA47NNQ2_MERPO|nr:Protein shisa-4 [Merluccius polli]
MAVGLSGVTTCVVFVILVPFVVAGDLDCKSYTDYSSVYHSSQSCYLGFCCGTCNSRYCCRSSVLRLTEEEQEDCFESSSVASTVTIGSTVVGVVICLGIFIACCVCPYCCLYKMCRKPRPVIATTTHTTVVTSTPQHYPQQPTASPGGQMQSYQGGQFPGYQPVPVQPGYAAQPTPQAYGAQPMHQGYGAQPMPAAPYPGYTPGPPPPYQEAIGSGYGPPQMAYSQAAFTPGQPPYPLQPPGQPQAQANAPPPPADQGQPAYNPAYAHPPPKTGY